MLQIEKLHLPAQQLQKTYGGRGLCCVYGAGHINRPRAMFIFMNPTARNISVQKGWKGLRAPWLGTKQVWKLFKETGFLSEKLYAEIQKKHSSQWDQEFSLRVYKDVAKNGAYITNLAKCTQHDARPLPDRVFKEYLDLMREEIRLIRPQAIITLGNQVSSIVLGKRVSVSEYAGAEGEDLTIGKDVFRVYPVHYPVGQGARNLPLAQARIQQVVRVR